MCIKKTALKAPLVLLHRDCADESNQFRSYQPEVDFAISAQDNPRFAVAVTPGPFTGAAELHLCIDQSMVADHRRPEKDNLLPRDITTAHFGRTFLSGGILRPHISRDHDIHEHRMRSVGHQRLRSLAPRDTESGFGQRMNIPVDAI